MPQSNRFQNASQILDQINAWQLEQEAKEERQKLLIQERKRKVQELKEFRLQQ